MFQKTIVIACLAAVPFFGAAQNEMDALRYSWTQRPASARSFGMGGAFGALGADISSFFGNPAGLGLYKRGGIELSFGLQDVTNQAIYAGGEATNGATQFSLNNFGIVGTRKPNNKDWIAVNFGIGFARTNFFKDEMTIRGTEFNTTLMDVFASQAAGIRPENLYNELPFGAGLAYETYAIDPLDTNGTGYVPASSGGAVDQVKNILRTGVQNETSFSFGANYRDKISIGGALFFQGIRFSERGRYGESLEGLRNGFV
jgi:hypothetical protein